MQASGHWCIHAIVTRFLRRGSIDLIDQIICSKGRLFVKPYPPPVSIRFKGATTYFPPDWNSGPLALAEPTQGIESRGSFYWPMIYPNFRVCHIGTSEAYHHYNLSYCVWQNVKKSQGRYSTLANWTAEHWCLNRGSIFKRLSSVTLQMHGKYFTPTSVMRSIRLLHPSINVSLSYEHNAVVVYLMQTYSSLDRRERYTKRSLRAHYDYHS